MIMGYVLEGCQFKNNQRQTQDDTDQKIQQIYLWLVDHIGQPAILYEKSGRELIPEFVKITGICGTHINTLGVRAAQRCYTLEGTFRTNIMHDVSVISLLTGDQKVVFFDEGI